MEVTLGKDGLNKSWQAEFPETVKCRCKGVSRIAFVAHEGMSEGDEKAVVLRSLHSSKGKGDLWPHDCCAVAVYLCKDCLKPTALFNQG